MKRTWFSIFCILILLLSMSSCSPEQTSELTPEQNKQFLRFVSVIEQYIDETKEYKNMPEAKGYYR